MRAGDPGGLLILGVPGPTLEAPERDVLRSVQPGGVILFGHNVESVAQVRRLVTGVRGAVPGVTLFVDAEGGRVDRFRGLFGRAPAARSLAQGSVARAEQAGRWIGHSIRSLGLDADCAPVVDLDHGADDNALGDRYLGRTPRAVTARARAFHRGLRSSGVGGCLKHFPGLGAATVDTHHEPANVALSRRELESDLRPYRDLAPDVGAVMVSHAIYPALDPDRRPASLSPAVVEGLLRGELGFDGFVVTDDLDMGALAPWGGPAERALHSLATGCDAAALCHSWRDAPRAVELLRRELPSARISRSLERWEDYRDRIAQSREAARRFTVETIRRRLAGLRRSLGEEAEGEDPTAYRG